MRPPSVGNPAKAPKPLDTDKHAPFPFNKASVSGLATACLARLYLYVYVFVRTSRIPRRATSAPPGLKKIQRDAHDPYTTDPQKFSAILAI